MARHPDVGREALPHLPRVLHRERRVHAGRVACAGLDVPYVVAGLAGVVLLFSSGAFLGAKGRAFRAVLAGMASHGADRPAPRMAPAVLVATLPTVNTGIAL